VELTANDYKYREIRSIFDLTLRMTILGEVWEGGGGCRRGGGCGEWARMVVKVQPFLKR
jgi:hypothetical protein